MLVHLFRKGVLQALGEMLPLLWRVRTARTSAAPLPSLDAAVALLLAIFEQISNGRVVAGSPQAQPYLQLTEFAERRLDLGLFIAVRAP